MSLDEADAPARSAPDQGHVAASADDASVVAALRARDEATFAMLLERYNNSLLRLAMTYLHDQASAEEVVQDAWIGLLESLDRFEGRSSLKTWLFRILVNCARARARKDARTIPFSAAFRPEELDAGERTGRFVPDWVPVLGGHWVRPVAQWQDDPEHRALAHETRAHIQRSIDELPPVQREVIMLRDVAGFDAHEVCNVLGLTNTNQRVILHRARTSVRRALERHFAEARA
ncbi:MAG: sigma-70 family RNA polymerase sigma factor [Dehalococcoidia bacterium]